MENCKKNLSVLNKISRNFNEVLEKFWENYKVLGRFNYLLFSLKFENWAIFMPPAYTSKNGSYF